MKLSATRNCRVAPTVAATKAMEPEFRREMARLPKARFFLILLTLEKGEIHSGIAKATPGRTHHTDSRPDGEAPVTMASNADTLKQIREMAPQEPVGATRHDSLAGTTVAVAARNFEDAVRAEISTNGSMAARGAIDAIEAARDSGSLAGPE